jgi:hypothetical protein
MPNPSIKSERVYRAARRSGASKGKAARIANAAAAGTLNRGGTGKRKRGRGKR